MLKDNIKGNINVETKVKKNICKVLEVDIKRILAHNITKGNVFNYNKIKFL